MFLRIIVAIARIKPLNPFTLLPHMSNIHKWIQFVKPMVHQVPMVRLVPIENGVIPMVLLVNVHLIKGT